MTLRQWIAESSSNCVYGIYAMGLWVGGGESAGVWECGCVGIGW